MAAVKANFRCLLYYFKANAEVLLRLFIYLYLSGITRSENEPQLYKRSDPMVQFSNDTILNNLVGNQKVWIVEFYSSWCGHCQAFAPKWTRLSWEISGWNKYVNVGVLDCAAERNYDACRSFEIEQYPTIKFFDVGWKNTTTKRTKSLGHTYKGEKDIKHIRRGLIDHIYQQPNNKLDKADIPFDFFGYEIVTSFMSRSRTTSFRYLALVFEQPESYTGKVLILDTSKCTKLAVRRVAHTNVEMTRRYQVSMFPSLILIPLLEGGYKELSPENRTHAAFLHALNKITDIVPRMPDESKPTNEVIVNEEAMEIAKNITSDVYMTDLLSGVSFALRREIPKKSVIEGDAFIALKDFAELLTKCLPAERHVASFLSQFNKWLHRNPLQTSVLSSEYLQFLGSHQEWDSYLPVKTEWRGCLGSKPRYRRYPCSLWTLFHTVTVRCGSTAQPVDLTGFQVINRIRKFIDHFFGCRYCRDHFVAMSNNIQNEIFSHEDSILWLWSRHNRVNARLRDDVSTDPVFPKVQYPPEYLCAECRKPTTYDNTLETDPGFGVEKVKWNKRVILEFLREHYGPDNIRIRDSEKHVIDDDSDNTDAVRRRFSYIFYPRTASPGSFAVVGLSNVDMSLCILLYGSIVAVVIGLYLYFIRRRKKKSYKSLV